MKKSIWIGVSFFLCFALGYAINSKVEKIQKVDQKKKAIIQKQKIRNMKLGAFSVSLSVKDLNISKAFYENLGFVAFGGSLEKHYLIMKNENSLIGLFEGMFKGNILTFNPGWDENAKNVADFDDVRDIQKELKGKNLKLDTEVDETTSGPGSIVLNDPDGNMILIDQHR